MSVGQPVMIAEQPAVTVVLPAMMQADAPVARSSPAPVEQVGWLRRGKPPSWRIWPLRCSQP